MKRIISAIAMLSLIGCAGGEAVEIESESLSLTGTTVDGRLEVDADGAFVITEDAVRLFDYFLTTEGEIDDAARRLLVAAEARKIGAAAFDAMTFYDQYVEYRRRFDAAVQKAGPAADADALVAQLRQVRAETVGMHPLFAEDDALVEQAIAAKRAMERGDHGEVARQMQLAALVAPKTEADVLADRAARLNLRLRHAVQHARETGADATAIHALRAEQVGDAAADRLARLDAERAAWQARVDEAAAAVDGLDPAARDAALAERFSARELRRVRTVLDLR